MVEGAQGFNSLQLQGEENNVSDILVAAAIPLEKGTVIQRKRTLLHTGRTLSLVGCAGQ